MGLCEFNTPTSLLFFGVRVLAPAVIGWSKLQPQERRQATALHSTSRAHSEIIRLAEPSFRPIQISYY